MRMILMKSSLAITPSAAGLKRASSLPASTSAEFFSRYLATSSLVTLPSGETASYRSSALPFCASMQTRSLAATSMRSVSYSAKAFVAAIALPARILAFALARRVTCASTLLLTAPSSLPIARLRSGASLASATTVLTRPWTSVTFSVVSLASASRDVAFSLSASTCSSPTSLESLSAADSRASTFSPRVSSSAMSPPTTFRTVSFSFSTSAFRLSASAFSFASLARRSVLFTLPIASSRAMPTADFRSWNSPIASPFLAPKRCLQIRSRLAFGTSNLYSVLAYCATSARFRSLSPSLSYLLNRSALRCSTFDAAILRAIRPLLALAASSASEAWRVAFLTRGS
mmetsp:Transcript_79459/g.208661  ORF Transcript_79459/g.208661 Transcript_79459/m.208661 type:complete len:344 (+) Transcript_79459:597-1628(+)